VLAPSTGGPARLDLAIVSFECWELLHLQIESGPVWPPQVTLLKRSVQNWDGWTQYVESGSDGNGAGRSGFLPNGPGGAPVTSQFGPGAYAMVQTITIPYCGVTTLSFQLSEQNNVGTFYNPNTMDYTVYPNQQARVDLLPATFSDWFGTTSISAVVLNLFNANSNFGAQSFSVDVSSLAGQTVQLAFRETDNQDFHSFGFDNVALSNSAVICPASRFVVSHDASSGSGGNSGPIIVGPPRSPSPPYPSHP